MIADFLQGFYSLFSGEKEYKNSSSDPADYVWCLVGNIIQEHEYGEEKEIRKGSKHFRPGAKVYPIKTFCPGDGINERITVIGIPRKEKKHIKVIMYTRHIENWRVRKVYHPYIIMLLREHFPHLDQSYSKRELEKFAHYKNQERYE